MKKLLTFAALGALALAGAVYAQTTPIQQVQTINPTTDLMQIIPRGAPSAQSFYVPPSALATQEQYAKLALTTSASYTSSPGYIATFSNFQADILLTATTAILYEYIVFAPNPSDGARECIYANQTVTSAYPTANTTVNAQVVNANNTITSMTANARYCFLYSASNLQWDRDGQ